jgi:hypothetical protein
MDGNKGNQWALGSIHFEEIHQKKEPYVYVDSIIHFQCTRNRTLHRDWKRWVGNQKRWEQAVKEAQEEINI